MAEFVCMHCGSRKSVRVEKHFTLAGCAVVFALPFVAAAIIGSFGEHLGAAVIVAAIALPLLGLAFAVVGRTHRHFCRDCKIRLG